MRIPNGNPQFFDIWYAKFMNWQAVSFDWNHVRAFLATAEEGSLGGVPPALPRMPIDVTERLGR